MTSTQREQWSPADFGAAMVAFVLAHAKHARSRRDGVTSEAFYRPQADNPEALRVWIERGAWADARANTSGGAKDFARTVAGMDLVPFMERWGRGGAPPANAPPRRDEQAKAARVLAEVRGLWDRCVPVLDDGEVTAYLRGRGLDAGRVVDGDVARALPASGWLPQGAFFRRKGSDRGVPWSEAGHRLVVPFFNAQGELSSLQARCIKANVDKSESKMSYGGATTRGLMFANRLARGLLTRHDGARAHVLDVSRTTKPERAGVVVCEGIVNFIAWAIDASDSDPNAPAVFGIGAGKGGWLPAYANAIDDGTRVLVDADDDADGNAYVNQIVETFAGRGVELGRMERAHG